MDANAKELATKPFESWSTEQIEWLFAHLSVSHFNDPVPKIVLKTVCTRDGAKLRDALARRFADSSLSVVAAAFDAFANVLELDYEAAVSWTDSKAFQDAFNTAMRRAEDSDPLQDSALAVSFARLCYTFNARPQFRKYLQSATSWLDSAISSSVALIQSFAAVSLVILRIVQVDPQASEQQDTDDAIEELVVLLLSLLGESKDDELVSLACAEGLGYVTLALPKYRSIVGTRKTLDQTRSRMTPRLHFAACNLVRNLTCYPQVESAQTRLQRMATPNAASCDETPAQVDARISDLLPSLLPMMQTLAKTESPAVRRQLGSIYLDIASQSKLRPAMLAAGVAKTLDTLIRSVRPPLSESDLDAIHALARLLITANPSIVFTDLTSPTRSLLMALGFEPDSPLSGQADLRTFEVLMALTNIASLPPRTASDAPLAHVIASTPVPVLSSTTNDIRQVETKSTMSVLNNLMLHERPLVRRAATELVCNLVTMPSGSSFFVPKTPNESSSSKIKLLLALTGSDDRPTRLAAGGALAIMIDELAPWLATQLEKEAKEQSKEGSSTTRLLVDMLEDHDDDEMLARALHVWTTTLQDSNVTQETKKKLLDDGLLEKLKAIKTNESVSEAKELMQNLAI